MLNTDVAEEILSTPEEKGTIYLCDILLLTEPKVVKALI